MIKLISIFLIVVQISGCVHIRYSIFVDNRSNQDIFKVKVLFANKGLSFGIVSKQASSSILDFNVELLDIMKITWTDSNNKQHEQTFKIFDFIPKDYTDGNVIFLYEEKDKFILKYFKPTLNYPKLVE
jgi:hypothetical protein